MESQLGRRRMQEPLRRLPPMPLMKSLSSRRSRRSSALHSSFLLLCLGEEIAGAGIEQGALLGLNLVLEQLPVGRPREADSVLAQTNFVSRFGSGRMGVASLLLDDEGRKKRSLLICMAAGWMSTPWMQSLMSSSLRDVIERFLLGKPASSSSSHLGWECGELGRLPGIVLGSSLRNTWTRS